MNILPIFSTPLWNTYYPSFEEDKDILLESLSNCIENYKLNKDENLLKNIHTKEEFRSLFNFICYIANIACDELNFVDRNIFITSSSVSINNYPNFLKNLHSYNDIFTGIFYLRLKKQHKILHFPNNSINLMWNGLKLCKQKNQYISKKIEICMDEGQIILWPSYLEILFDKSDDIVHQNDEDSISILFNILSLPKEN